MCRREAQRSAFDDVPDPYRTPWVKPPEEPAFVPLSTPREQRMPPIAGFTLGFMFGFIVLIVAWARKAQSRTTRWLRIGFGVRLVATVIKVVIEEAAGQ